MKHLAHYFKDNYQPEISTMPEPSLGIVVVIPCFNEPDVEKSIRALANCSRPAFAVEVLVIVNFGEQLDDAVKSNCRNNYAGVQALAKELSGDKFKIYPVLKGDLPSKFAGVGLARKIGMDEAAFRFARLNCPQGLILCFDADSVCDDNYLIAIEEHYKQYPATQASSVYYEHPLAGDNFPEDIYQGIAQYELHLRYYNQASRMACLPFAYHTVGSSMVCTASAYAKVGGMNRRKAGEDFYFLQKLIPLGHFTEINTTRVIPSPRISDRVPFGTGRAMMKYIDDKQPEMLTYPLEAFFIIKELTARVSCLFKADKAKCEEVLDLLHPYLSSYLIGLNYYDKLEELNGNCTDYTAFKNRFFRWFDAFRTLKFLNYLHDSKLMEKKTVVQEANNLLALMNADYQHLQSAKEVLRLYRAIERK